VWRKKNKPKVKQGGGAAALCGNTYRKPKKPIPSFHETRTDPVDFANSLPARHNYNIIPHPP